MEKSLVEQFQGETRRSNIKIEIFAVAFQLSLAALRFMAKPDKHVR
jgi:hypothetical protein